MEIYVNSAEAERTVLLEFPVMDGAQVDAYAYVEDEQVFEFSTLTVVADGYEAIIPLFLVQFDSTILIHWTVTYIESSNLETYTVSKITPVEVVTPILSRREIREIDANLFATNAEADKIEKAVRHIVQAYTGQEFGHLIGTKEVSGSGGTALQLPTRLLELESINGISVNPATVDITASGYVLRVIPFGAPPVKADYDGFHYHTGGIIHNPNSVKVQTFPSNYDFEIKGRWGWETVPAAVKEAAKLLVNDYACADSQYRDRYLTSMTAADWRIQFNSGAFARTGNVRADQLLSEFVLTRGWGVI